jgi:hypothetical protein
MSQSQQEPTNTPDPDEERLLFDPKAMRALAHPVRTALLELLTVTDTLTATQASEILGESPANCAFHLRTLGKYGFVKEAGGGRGRERPWTASGPIRISVRAQTDPQAALAAETLGRVWLEQWLERARVVYGTKRTPPAGWEGSTKWSWDGVYLTAEEADSVFRELCAIVHRYADRQRDVTKRPPGAIPVEWALFSAPITELAHLGERDAQAAGNQLAGTGTGTGTEGTTSASTTSASTAASGSDS